MGKLTPKQKRFCEEYAIDLNGKQAAIRAGYSEGAAKQIASENLTKHDVVVYVAELQSKRLEYTEITQEYVLSKLSELIEVSSQPHYKEVIDAQGEPKMVAVFIDPTALQKGIELAGRYRAMWVDKKIIDVNDISKDQENKILSEITRLRDQRQQVLQ